MSTSDSQTCLNVFLKEQFVALSLLYKGNLLTPFLMVFFSTIEVLGHITSLDFDGFVKRYLSASLPDQIKSVDLWGARCAILHSNSPQSKHSKEKRARQILYAWGKADINLAKEIIEKAGNPNDYTYVRVEDLYDSLGEAVKRMQHDFVKNPLFWKNCSKKINKFYSRLNLSDLNK